MVEESGEIEIKQLEELIDRYVDNKKIVETKVTNLTVPGENFGSTILKIDIILEDDLGMKEYLNLFAKMIPPTQLYRQLFNIQVTFKLEAAFYEVIIPNLQSFQREQGIAEVMDFFPKFYGARINLDGSEIVDENGVIILENLKLAGFVNLNRHIGCNLDTTKLILKNLAQFHAVPIAIKLLQPNLFEKKIKAYMACFHPKPPSYDNSPAEQNILNILKDRESCIPMLSKLEKSFKYAFDVLETFREPFATIVHRDMWVNNFLVKLDADQVVTNKFVDFQGYTYDSPVRDLLFFLFTSVQYDIIRRDLDNLLYHYHEQFSNTLKELNCDNMDFSYEKFIEEIKHSGIHEIGHIIYMLLFIVRGEKEFSGTGGDPGLAPKEKIPSDVKEKAWWILEEFDNRNWI